LGVASNTAGGALHRSRSWPRRGTPGGGGGCGGQCLRHRLGLRHDHFGTERPYARQRGGRVTAVQAGLRRHLRGSRAESRRRRGMPDDDEFNSRCTSNMSRRWNPYSMGDHTRGCRRDRRSTSWLRRVATTSATLPTNILGDRPCLSEVVNETAVPTLRGHAAIVADRFFVSFTTSRTGLATGPNRVANSIRPPGRQIPRWGSGAHARSVAIPRRFI
jgi:hypothetical protein